MFFLSVVVAELLGKGTLIMGLMQTVMVLKYLIQDYPIQTLYFGIANVVANGLVMIR